MPARQASRPEVLAESKRGSRVATFIRELEAVGPDFAEISRRLGEPRERVRYLFNSTIKKNGYVVAARINRTALGLREAYALVDIADRYQDKMAEIATGMDDHWFLQAYYRTMPEGKFLLAFSMPEEHYDELPALLGRLEELGLVSKVHVVTRSSWRRFSYMNAETFDFKHGRWEFDWAHMPAARPFERPKRSVKQWFDSWDVRLLLYLLVNATTPLSEIARMNNVSSKTVHLHARHIAEAGLISGCGVNWTRTHINLESGRPFAPRHKFAFLSTLVRSVTLEEQARLSEKLWVLPYMWFEAAGDYEDYTFQLVVPLEQIIETMSYLRETLRPVADRSTTVLNDPGYSGGYSPPLFLVDDAKGDWVFDMDAQMRRLREQLELALKKQSPQGLPSR